MVGITLSSEQIRSAPSDVRRWIEREVMTSLGQQTAPVENRDGQGEHLVSCDEGLAAAILSQIQGILPAVNVFFEFGRQGAFFGEPSLEAFRLLDIAHHTRLPNVAQVIACLEIINRALGRIRSDSAAAFCAFDHDGHCFIPAQTQQSILHLWQKIVAGQQLTADQTNAPPSHPQDLEASITQTQSVPNQREVAIQS